MLVLLWWLLGGSALFLGCLAVFAARGHRRYVTSTFFVTYICRDCGRGIRGGLSLVDRYCAYCGRVTGYLRREELLDQRSFEENP